MTTKEAIADIVTANTLPPQIDYRLPWRIKEEKANEFLKTLPKEERDKAYKQIQKQINDYCDSDAVYYDSLF